ncbi:MAG: deoxyhypusine synthase family protein [Candidatus Aenigmarchaeota archaeon]|nr:deoxyhypusine synthase family protein [Candidatus Aenigmarchaeota archaeon]
MSSMHPVNHIKITSGMSAAELVKQMSASGVMGAGRIAKGAEILQKMLADKDCTVFFGQAGCMIPGGMKEIIHDILLTRRIRVFVTTGATLTHDTVEALGYKHYQGTASVDDAELNKKGLDRMYDSYMPNEVYEGLEDFFQKNWDALTKAKSIRELLDIIGSLLPKESILRICHELKIPVFCPALADSGIGLMIWGRLAAGKKLDIPAFDDMKEIISIAWDSKKNGVFYVGGGVPKNFCQQAMQFSKQASYGVQITTDRPEWGGSSGAELREGISWGKLEPNAEFVDVFCDATIALPLMWAAVRK